MAVKEGYDVLRLIEHGQTCYISSEYVRGRPLAWYIKEHPRISKKLLLEWILHLERQLEMLHKCRNHPCYQYVNPYSIIVSEEGGLYFSDMEAGSNEEMLRLMRKKNIREHFLPPGMPYYRKASVSLDAYGLGKTVQYLLAMTEADPKLNWKETGRLRKMTSHCLNQFSKRQIQNISEIRKYIPIYQEKQPNIAGKSRAILAVAALLCVLAAACRVGITASRTQDAAMKSEERGNGKISADNEKETDAEHLDERMELAFAYFLELEDYQKVLDTLKPIQDSSTEAEALAAVAAAFTDPEHFGEKETLQMQLEKLEREADRAEKDGKSKEALKFRRCTFQGYLLLDTRDGAKEAIRLGEKCLENEKLEEQEIKRIRAGMAASREKLEEYEAAADMYAQLLETAGEDEERLEYFGKAAALYEECGRGDMALEICIRAVEEFPQERILKLLHIRLLCQDTSIDRTVCAQTIREYLGQDPALKDSEEFQKLQKEYGIRVEGGEVWVGE